MYHDSVIQHFTPTIPQANENHVSHSQIGAQSKACPERSAEWSEQNASNGHLFPSGDLIPSLYGRLATGELRGLRYQESSSPCIKGFPGPAI